MKRNALLILLCILTFGALWSQAIYNEGFETGALPSGWVNGGVTFVAAPGTGHGSYSAFCSDKTKYMILPKMANPFWLTVDGFQSGNGNCVPEFSTSPNVDGPWTRASAYTNITNGVWSTRFQSISPVPASGVYLKIGMSSNSNTAMYIDNITVRPQAYSYNYRTIASGNWENPNIWQYELTTALGTWYGATVAPNDSLAVSITIKNGHTATLSANINTDQTMVEAGAILTINNGVTLGLIDGAGTDLIVNGKISTLGTGVVSGSGSFALASGAVLETAHPQGISSSPNTGCIQTTGGATFDSGANYIYRGSTAQVTGNALPANVNTLAITNTTATVSLTNNVTVTTNYNMATGAVLTTTNASMLSFASGATGTGTGTVNGPVKQNSTTITSSSTFSNVYLGLAVTSGASAVNTFMALKTDVVNPVFGNSSISKTWNLSGSTSTTSAITLSWNSSADNGNSFSSGYGTIWRYNGSAWERVGTKPVTTVSGIRSVSFNYTLGTACDFTILAANPVITASSLADFGGVKINTISSSLAYNATGVELYANMVINAPAGFEISTLAGSGYGPTVSLTPSNGYVNSTPIYVRFTPTNLGEINGNITHASTGATSIHVTATGTGVNNPVITTPIAASINTSSAYLGGTITNLNYSIVSTRGIYWSTEDGFADGEGTLVSTNGVYGTGAFSAPVSGLSANTTYYFKAFATNAAGTTYTEQSTFVTLAAYYYRTIASGDWNNPAIWEYSLDNEIWYSTTIAPDELSLGILIRNPHVVTLTADVIADQLVINTGGELVVNSGITLNVNNGAGIDIAVYGTLTTLGTGILSGPGSFSLGSGATLVTQNVDGVSTIASTGCVQVMGGIVLDEDANYIFNGTNAQVTGNAIVTANNLTLHNSAGLKFTNPITINGVLTQVAGDIISTTTDFVDGYESPAYNFLSFPETGSNITGWNISVSTPQTLMPDYVNRQWIFNGSYSGDKTVTFYWNNTDDIGFDWTGAVPKVWKGGVTGTGYTQIDYDVTSATRYVTVIISSSMSKGTYVIGQDTGDDTLPVELCSFTAFVTQQSKVRLNWITQSETGILGYYIYRNSNDNIEGATLVSPLISATNTSFVAYYSYADNEVPGTGLYYYWLQNQDINGEFEFFGPLMANVQIYNNDTPAIPQFTSLNKPYPNPFNPSVTIAFGLAKAEHVQILIYNNKGQKVCTLLDAAKNPGSERLVWDGTNGNGKALSTGIYYVKMTAGDYKATQKIVLMK